MTFEKKDQITEFVKHEVVKVEKSLFARFSKLVKFD